MGSNLVQYLLERKYVVHVVDIAFNKEFDKYNDNEYFYFHLTDITDESEINKLKSFFSDQKIMIDVLINNAAINPDVNKSSKNFSRLENFSVLNWDQELDVGLKGSFLLSKHFGPMISKSNDGVILNVSSDLGIISPDQRLYEMSGKETSDQPVKPVTYSVIKSGLIGLTKYLSTYWRPNLRSIAICPGGIQNNQNQEFQSKVSNLIPLGRLAEVNEICSVIEFLISDNASYINGAVISVDGGRVAW